MRIEGEGQRISVYVGSSDTWQGTNLAIAIVGVSESGDRRRNKVSRGIMGFGKHSPSAICLASPRNPENRDRRPPERSRRSCPC